MAIQAKLKVRLPGTISEKVVGDARVIHMSGDDRHCLTVFKATSEAQLEELLAGNEPILQPKGLIDRAGTWALAQCACPRVGTRVLPIVRAFGCTVMWPVVEADGHKFYTVLAPSRTRIRELVERLSATTEVTVERVRKVSGATLDVSVSLSDVTQNLTKRQLDALKTAVASGYYDSPRRAYAEELARTMGMSRSTYQEHLQKAESFIVKTFVSLVLDHPALDAQATKGRGRPKADLDSLQETRRA